MLLKAFINERVAEIVLNCKFKNSPYPFLFLRKLNFHTQLLKLMHLSATLNKMPDKKDYFDRIDYV